MFRISGEHGAVFYGYRRAADLGHWEFDAGIVIATLTRSDPFLLTQRPLTFVVPNGNGRPPFKRRIDAVTVIQSTLTARFAPKGT
jgi:hypothetical protein